MILSSIRFPSPPYRLIHMYGWAVHRSRPKSNQQRDNLRKCCWNAVAPPHSSSFCHGQGHCWMSQSVVKIMIMLISELNNVCFSFMKLCVEPYKGVLWIISQNPLLSIWLFQTKGWWESSCINFVLNSLFNVFFSLFDLTCVISLRCFQVFVFYIWQCYTKMILKLPLKWEISGPGFIFLFLSELMDLIHNWLVKWNVWFCC